MLELDGISRASVTAHHALYQGFVAKRNEILARLARPGRPSDAALRALKVELSFAVGGIKNHEIYFEHLGGAGGEPTGAIAALLTRDFGSAEAWRADLKATALAARGWAWTAYDWDEARLFNHLGDDENVRRSGTRRPWSPSTSRSTRTSSTSRPTGRPTWTRSSRTWTGRW